MMGKKRLLRLLLALCILSVVLEFGIHRYGHFGPHSIDGIFGFYAILGFVSCAVCIAVAKVATFLKVKEDYYDK